MSEKIKVTIDRAKWRTGAGGAHESGIGETKLLNDSGFQCCLGFCVRAAVPNANILGVNMPAGLGGSIPELSDLKRSGRNYSKNTVLAGRAAKINDDRFLRRAEREEKLLELFRDSIYAIEFFGEYTNAKD
jgi:hypothetical protein